MLVKTGLSLQVVSDQTVVPDGSNRQMAQSEARTGLLGLFPGFLQLGFVACLLAEMECARVPLILVDWRVSYLADDLSAPSQSSGSFPRGGFSLNSLA